MNMQVSKYTAPYIALLSHLICMAVASTPTFAPTIEPTTNTTDEGGSSSSSSDTMNKGKFVLGLFLSFAIILGVCFLIYVIIVKCGGGSAEDESFYVIQMRNQAGQGEAPVSTTATVATPNTRKADAPPVVEATVC
jgi:hypothetical protein